MTLPPIESLQEILSITIIDQVSQQKSPHSSANNPQNLQNAGLDSMHTSPIEPILQWPHFDIFPSLRQI
jgi:hypothetical protein